MRMVAVVLGGGLGQRLGAGMPKQLLTLGGRTLIEHCVAAFDRAPGIDEILVVMARGYTARAQALLAGDGLAGDGLAGDGLAGDGLAGDGLAGDGLAADGLAGAAYRKVTGVIEGGPTRPDSTRAALAAIAAGAGAAGDCGVLLHDAARPLVDQRIIADCVAALGEHDAAGVAVPASDTMVVTENGVMHSMPRRETLQRCQTPQCFRLSVIARAHELAAADPGFAPTDDCGVVMRYLPEVAVHIVPGSERNIKVTYPHDLAVAEALLRG
jgi:2-C-methyl-D-erythritol 4-phosphate cytidylyltransferase